MAGEVAVTLPEPGHRWRNNPLALHQYDILVGSTVIVRDGPTAALEELFMERSHNKRLAIELRRQLERATRRGFATTHVSLSDLDYLLTKLENADT